MSRENPEYAEVSLRIKTLRKELKETQESFGKTIGLKRQDIHAIETGNRKPGLTVLYRISIEFNVSLDWIVFGIKEDHS
jgi:DNA-binding XRE family transcriptional regulator